MCTGAPAELDAVRNELELLVDRRSRGDWSLDDETRYGRLAEIEQLYLGRERDPADLTTSSG